MSEAFSVRTTSPEQTRSIGYVIGRLAQPGDVLLLVGTLGAGKTCLVQGVAAGLGWMGPVTSPTFVLMNQYDGRLRLYHIDLYRIEADAEAFDLGMDDYFFGDGVCAVEWPERAMSAMPDDYVRIDYQYVSDTERRLTISASGQRSEQRLGVLRVQLASSGLALEPAR